MQAECADFRATLDAAGNPFAEPFLTAPSPGMVSAIVKNEHYPTEEAFLAALGAALRDEYKAIVDAGFLLQLDCPDLAREKHNTFADRPLADFIAFGNRVVDAINAAIHDIPPEKVRLHVCWGNYEGPHDLDVELQEIIPFLKRAKVGGFVLPFANPRHAHEYRYLKDLLAKDQIIVAGVIDSTTNFVEHPEVIAERLENVARAIGDPQRVMAGSDCGFETIAGRGRVAEDVVWAKFKSMAEGAQARVVAIVLERSEGQSNAQSGGGMSMRQQESCTALAASLCVRHAGARLDWNFYHHQSAPLFATSRGAKMLSEEIEKATNGELKARLHLSGTLQIAPNNITPAVAEQRGADRPTTCSIPATSRSPAFRACPAWCAPTRSSPRPPTCCGPIWRRPSPKGHRDARRLHLSAAGDVGKEEAHLARRHQGHEAARRAARAGRDGAPLRRHLGDDQRAGSALRARPRRGRRHLHRRRRRRAVEGPAEVRLS